MLLDDAIKSEAWSRYLAAAEQVKQAERAHGGLSAAVWHAVAVAERALADHYDWLAKCEPWRAGWLHNHASSLRWSANQHAEVK